MESAGAHTGGLPLLKAEILKALHRYLEAETEYNAFLAARPVNQHPLQSAQLARDELVTQLELQSVTSAWLTELDSRSPANAWVKILAARTKELGSLRRRAFDLCEPRSGREDNLLL